MNLVTKAEYARRHNVSRAAVGNWVREGRIVIVDDLVDLEASDAKLVALRDPRAVMRAEQRAETRAMAAGGIASMPLKIIQQRLEALDWKTESDWSDEAMNDRARKAANCIGWEALTSNLRDDGHWGGFQLREIGVTGRCGVVAGYGFELTAAAVIATWREELESDDEEDGEFKKSVQTDLISALALPHWRGQQNKPN